MSDPVDKYKYKFVYNEDLTEIGVIFNSNEEITPTEYIDMLEAWLLFCRQSLHEMWKDRPSLEKDVDLN